MPKLRSFFWIALVAVACEDVSNSPLAVSASPAIVPMGPAWQPTDLGVQPLFAGPWSVTGISSVGHVVGLGRVAGLTRAGRVTPAGAWDHLPPLSGDVVSYVLGVNKNGIAVGLSSTDPRFNSAVPVMWNAQGRPEAIPGLSRSPNATAVAVNDAGLVIGNGLRRGTTTDIGFVWRPGSAVVPLADAPGNTGGAFAVALNDRGVLLGGYSTTGQATGFMLWDRDGRVLSYHLFPGYFLSPAAINNEGEVVGGGRDAQTLTEIAWVWSSTAGLRILPAPSGAVRPEARAIDDRGRVYGFTHSPPAPVMWTEGRAAVIPAMGSASVYMGYASRSGYVPAVDTAGGVRREQVWVPVRP